VYAKIFESILRSSVWVNHPPHVRVAWIGLLLLARPGRLPDGRRVGIVQGTPLGLARALSLEPEQFEEALQVLMAPDPDSTSMEFDGRRVIQLKPNRWAIVNFCRYQRMRDEDHRRMQSRELMRELREARKGGAAVVRPEDSSAWPTEGTKVDINGLKVQRTSPNRSTGSARCANNANIANRGDALGASSNEPTSSARCANNANIFETGTQDGANQEGSVTSARCANNANIANSGGSSIEGRRDRFIKTGGAILAHGAEGESAILAPSASAGAQKPEFSTVFPQGAFRAGQVVDCVGYVSTCSTAFPQLFHNFSTGSPQEESAVATRESGEVHKSECKVYYDGRENKKISQGSIVVGEKGDRGESKGGKGGKGVVTSPTLFADQVQGSEPPSKAKQSKGKKSPASAVWELHPGEEPVMTFPCEGETDTWALSPSGLRWLKEHYRTVDVEAELRSARAWLFGNPGRLKTARGMPRYLINWLEKAARDRRGYKRQPDLLAGVEDLLKGAEKGGEE
jgi:hypothetical protein